MKRRPLIALLAAAALALAACGDDDDDRGNLNVETGARTGGATQTTATTETAPTGPAATTIRVRETDFELDPQNPRIARTGIVAFSVRNAGDATHALEVEGPTGEQETDPIQPGGSATLKVNFDRPGRYTWYCPIGDHESRGMKGVITVGGGGARGSDDDGSGTSGQGRGRGRGGDERGGSDDRGGSGGGVSGY